MADKKNIIELAERWRNDNQECEGGVVLIENDLAYGWKSTLREPEKERPGALAVDSDGHIFEAQGGNDYDGAKCRVAVVSE
ncbi:antirestriction protein ArdR [Enterobacter kobei]|uniref:antirestriction protein ArdR n=1 Tax=Enterobacter kobei TaxID=208224 RepID=UPI003CF47DEE